MFICCFGPGGSWMRSWPLFSLTFLAQAASVEAKPAIVFTDFSFLLSPILEELRKLIFFFNSYFFPSLMPGQTLVPGVFTDFFQLFTASVRSWPPGPPAVPGVFSSVFNKNLSRSHSQSITIFALGFCGHGSYPRGV